MYTATFLNCKFFTPLNEKEAEASEKKFQVFVFKEIYFHFTNHLLHLILKNFLQTSSSSHTSSKMFFFFKLTQTATITAIEAIRLGRQSFSCCYKLLKQQFNDHIGAKMKTFLIN